MTPTLDRDYTAAAITAAKRHMGGWWAEVYRQGVGDDSPAPWFVVYVGGSSSDARFAVVSVDCWTDTDDDPSPRVLGSYRDSVEATDAWPAVAWRYVPPSVRVFALEVPR